MKHYYERLLTLVSGADAPKITILVAPKVTLLVGEAKRAFRIREAALFEVSSFFKAKFTSDSQESSERIMALPEEDESIFELFVDWTIHRRYNPSKADDPFMQPAQLFVLAEKYDVPNLKSLILLRFFLLITERKVAPPLDTLAYAYQRTAQDSGIRRMAVDYLACEMKPDWFRQADARTWLRDHPDISADVIVSFAKHTVTITSPFNGKMLQEYMYSV